MSNTHTQTISLLITFFLAKYSFKGTHNERSHEKQQPNMESMEFRGRGMRLKIDTPPSFVKPLSITYKIVCIINREKALK
jgi:hypothetical protein